MLKTKIREELLNCYNHGNDEILKCIKKKCRAKYLVTELLEFKDKFPSFYNRVFKLSSHKGLPSGLGHGELLIYFLYDDIELSGYKNSADLIKNGKKFLEVKTVKLTKEYYYDFRLGPEVRELSRIFIEELKKLKDKFKEYTGDSPDIINWEEIPKRVLDYIDGFGDLNDKIIESHNLKISLQLDNVGNLSLNDKIVANIEDQNLKHVLKAEYDGKIKLAEKLSISSLSCIKNQYVDQLKNISSAKLPILLFNSITGSPIKIINLKSCSIKIIRISAGQVRIGILIND